MRFLAVVAVACGLLAATPGAAPAGSRKPVKVAYREASGVVQPGTTDGFTLTCPKAEPNAIAGYFGTDSDATGPEVTLTESAPFASKISRKWIMAVKDLTDTPQRYYVGTVCASGGPYLRVGDNGAVEAGKSDGFDEKCPRKAPSAVSGTFYTTAAQDTGQLELATSLMGAHSWSTELHNVSPDPQPYSVGAVCAPPSVRVRYLGGEKHTAQPGTSDGVIGTCPRTAPHGAGGGFGIPAGDAFGDVTMDSSFPAGGGGRKWAAGVVNPTTSPHDYYAAIVCLG